MRVAGRFAWLITVLAFVLGASTAVPIAAAERIVAVGDIHGSPDAFLRILRKAELVDEAGEWVGGDAVLAQTGDLVDRGTQVRELLDLMRRLEQSAAAGGGRLVSLLGNHEVYNLIGFFDYQSTPVSAFTEIAAAFSAEDSEKVRKRGYKQWQSWARKYRGCGPADRATWMALHPPGFLEFREALSPQGDYGKWLRARDIVANVDGTLFLHGGLSPAVVEMGVSSIDEINRAGREEIAQFDRDFALLQNEKIVLPFSTLPEIYCALAHELPADPPATLSAEDTVHRARLLQIRDRLPSAENWLLLDENGPVWFRGYARWTDEEAEPALETVFSTFGGERVVVGHTPHPGKIQARFDGRVFLIDTAMAYAEVSDGRPAALEILGDQVYAIYEDGRVSLSGEEDAAPTSAGAGASSGAASRAPYPAVAYRRARGHDRGYQGSHGPRDDDAAVSDSQVETAVAKARWLARDGSPLPFESDEEVLAFLTEASVLESTPIGKGITQPKRLVLEKDGVRARAIFHDVAITRTRHRLATGEMVMYFRDSYENNVAAYELSRIMGIQNVPPAAVRTVKGKKGSVQLWIEDSIDEEERRSRSSNAAVPADVRRSIADMWVFDNLINNIDRNQGNMLFDSVGGFWWVDHTRAFARAQKLPSPVRIKRCSRSLLAAIRDLDRPAVNERLAPFMSKFEIKALFKRRAMLLDFLDKRLAAEGEDKVLFDYGEPDDAVTVVYEAEAVPSSPDR